MCACLCVNAWGADIASSDFMRLSRGSLVSSPAVARPEANMRSTSALLTPNAVAIPGNAGRMTARNVGTNTQMMSYTPLYTSSMSRKSVRSSQFSTAGMAGVQLSAISISRDNFNEATASSDGSLNTNTLAGPRRGRGGPDFPDDPPGLDTPVGDVPLVLLVIMIMWYICSKCCKKQSLFSKTQEK